MKEFGLISISAFFIAFATTALIMPRLIVLLKDSRLFDRPVDRSSHKKAKLTGAGWAVIPVCLVLISSLFYIYQLPYQLYCLPAAAFALMMLSWCDDICPSCPGKRFLCQAVIVVVALMALPEKGLIFQGLLPFWLDRIIGFLALLWFINLYNFMDGIDGITGVQSIFLGVSISLLLVLSPFAHVVWVSYGMIIAGAVLAFLLWNWHPARIFMGDVGAVPLGLLIGWYLLLLACLGYIWPACILPLYYCFDTTITLVRRLKQGFKPWEAHRFFFFQASTPHKFSHDRIVLIILGQNIVLLLCALLVFYADDWLPQWIAILASGCSVLVLLSYFESKRI